MERVLFQSAFSADMEISIDRVDIGDWLMTLPEAEYIRCCPPDHIAAGVSRTEDGRPMAINVEMIGTGLVVQHYVAEELGRTYCRMVSQSDVFTPRGRTKIQMIWELSAKALDGSRSRYTNRVTSHPTEAFMAFLAEHGLSYADAAAARQTAGGDHNRRETPLFAASIARHAGVD